MIVLNIGFLVAIILIIWFRSDAFVQYVNFFKLGWFFWIPLYESQKEDDPLLTYPQFIKKNFNGIVPSILSCPLCFTVWLVSIFVIIFNTIVWWPIIVIIALGTYNIFTSTTKWT
jgi:hypothetical protein